MVMFGRIIRILATAAGAAAIAYALTDGGAAWLYAGFALMEIASVSFALCAPARRIPLILALACTGALACAQRKMLEPREAALLAAAVGALWPGCLGAETLLAPYPAR